MEVIGNITAMGTQDKGNEEELEKWANKQNVKERIDILDDPLPGLFRCNS